MPNPFPFPYGLPGEAWQPAELIPPVPGQPGEIGARLAGSGPQVPSAWLQPALNPAPTVFGELPPGTQPVGQLPPGPTVRPMPAAPQQAPNMFGSRAGQRVGTGNVPSMQDLTPRGIPAPLAQRAQQMQNAVVSEIGAPVSGAGGAAGAPRNLGPTPSRPYGPINPSARTFGPSAPLKNSLNATGPTNANPFPQMTGTPSLPKTAGGWWKGAKGLGVNAAKGAAIPIGLNLLSSKFDNPSLRAATTASNLAWLGGPAVGGVTAAGVGAGDAGGRIVTGAPQWFSRDVMGNSAEETQQLGQVQSAALGEMANRIPGPIDDFLIDQFGDKLNAGNVSRGLDSIPLIGDLFKDEAADAEAQAAAQQTQAAEVRASLPAMMTDLGIEDQTMSTALDQLEQDIALMRIQAQNGLLLDDEDKPISPDQVESIAMAGFIQSTLPELIDIDRQRQDALARAAGFQAVLGNQMQPFADQQRALAESAPAALMNPYLPPEMVGPMQAFGEAQRSGMLQQANAWQAAGQMIPAMAAMDQQQALQRQIDQLLMQQMLQGARDGGQESEADAILGQ